MINKRAVLAALLAGALLLAGCMPNIVREDAAEVDLPALDPSLGLDREENVTLYYRLAGEPVLVPFAQHMAVRPNENMIELILSLMEQAPVNARGIVSALPARTLFVSASYEKNQVTVTLSKAFLGEVKANETREEAQLSQKLAVYAVVCTLCSISNIKSVQLLIDTNDSGIGAKLPPFMLGFTSEEVGAQSLGPLSHDGTYIASPIRMATLALDHLVGQEYEKAYALFAVNELDGEQVAYSQFQRQMSEEYRLVSYASFALRKTDNSRVDQAVVDLTVQKPDGEPIQIRQAPLSMQAESGLYRLDYLSLLQALRQGETEGDS